MQAVVSATLQYHPSHFGKDSHQAAVGVRAGQMILGLALSPSALQLSVFDTRSSALETPRGLVLCRPCPKESAELAESTPTAHFE